jgi:hypothetical protein
MIFETLWESAKKGELLLVEGGFCHWHLRRDGQLTIREIISLRRGAGAEMLERLKITPDTKSIFAKCPADLDANNWYKKNGFSLENTEVTKNNREVNHWRLSLT